MNKEKLKGFVSGILVMTLFFTMTVSVFAATGSKSLSATYNNIKLSIFEKEVTPKDINGNIVEPFIVNGTTYLPVRAVADALGQPVNWDANTKTVKIGGTANAYESPIKLIDGNYIAGVDFPAGTYNITADFGSGNVISDDYRNTINIIMVEPQKLKDYADYDYITSFNNAVLNAGTTLRVGLTITLTKVR